MHRILEAVTMIIFYTKKEVVFIMKRYGRPPLYFCLWNDSKVKGPGLLVYEIRVQNKPALLHMCRLENLAYPALYE